MQIVREKTFAKAYSNVLSSIWNNAEYSVSPRGKEIKEVLNSIVEIEDPTSNLFKNDARQIPEKYLAGELFWYFSGRNDLEFIQKYSGFWKNIANDDGTVNSAYGYLLFVEKNQHGLTEWQWAYEQLKRDKDTRQAIIRFNKPRFSYEGNKDFVCTLNGVFNIRNDALHFTIMMRSQDEILGRTFDVPLFTLLQQQMRNHLLPIYPTLKLGKFTQHNISSHIYADKYDITEKMLLSGFTEYKLPELKEDLIDPTGKFDNQQFNVSTDPLKVWIKSRLM